MGANQSTAVNAKTLMTGSAKIEASFDNQSTFQNLGLTNSLNAQVNQTPLDQKPQNGTKYAAMKGVAEETATASFELFEIDLETITKLNGNVGKYTAVSGTPVTGATQKIVSGNWEFNKPVLFNVMSTVEPTITSVTGSVDGLLVKDTDYFISKGAGSSWTINVIDSATVTVETQDIDIVFDYTPKVSEKMSSGGGTTQDEIALRLTNKTQYKADAAVAAELSIAIGEGYNVVTVMTLHKGVQTSGFGLDFKDKDATDPALSPAYEFEFEVDENRPVLEQLYDIERYNEKLNS